MTSLLYFLIQIDSVADLGFWIRCFFCLLDPGLVKIQDPDP
jgi:hypothetical protein